LVQDSFDLFSDRSAANGTFRSTLNFKPGWLADFQATAVRGGRSRLSVVSTYEIGSGQINDLVATPIHHRFQDIQAEPFDLLGCRFRGHRQLLAIDDYVQQGGSFMLQDLRCGRIEVPRVLNSDRVNTGRSRHRSKIRISQLNSGF
jgi:hypothetical protein